MRLASPSLAVFGRGRQQGGRATRRVAGLLSGTLVALCLLCLAGCQLSDDRGTVDVVVPAYFNPSKERKSVSRRLRLETAQNDARKRGARVYKDACMTCHGRRGDGLGEAAEALDPPPWDLTMGAFVAAEEVGENLDEGIFYVVSHGVADTSMEGFGKLLSAEDRWAVTLYVKELVGVE